MVLIFNILLKRSLLVFIIFLYGFSIDLAHSGYLFFQNHTPGIYSHFYNKITISEWVFIFLLLSSTSFCIPIRFRNPSDLFVILIYFFIYIPFLIICFGYRFDALSTYYPLIFVTTISLFIISTPTFFVKNNRVHERVLLEFKFKKLIFILLGFWFILGSIVFYNYYSIMSFSGINEIYNQRIKGKAQNLYLGYLQVYYSYFLSSIIFAYGVSVKNKFYGIVGILGFITLFLITAERTSLILPIFIYLVYILFKSRSGFYFKLIIGFGFISFYNLLVSFFYKESVFLYESGFYILNRIIVTPGIFLLHYYDFFSTEGFTNFSHVRGLGLFLNPSDSLLSYNDWQSIGPLIAKYVHNIDSNSNASFWATDGVAALGAVGVIIISIFLSIYLYLINRLSQNIPISFITSAIFPLALALTNASFFTIMLSFGGIAWVFLLLLLRAGKV